MNRFTATWAVWGALLGVVGGPLGLAAGSALLVAVPTVAAAQDSGDASPAAQVTALLKRARQAMEDGDLEVADSLLSRAEKLGVRFGVLHLGDTPKKARRDLERLRKSAPAGTDRPSAEAEAQTLSEQESPQADSEGDENRPPSSAESLSAGPAEDLPSATAPPRSGAPSLSDVDSRARRFLANARRELGRSNLAAAEHWYRQAAGLGASWSADEDSPDKLLADLGRAGRQVTPLAVGDVAAGVEALSEAAASGQFPELPGEESPFGQQLPQAPPAGDEDLSPVVRTLAAGRRSGEPAGNRDASDPLLRAGRQALAAGDLPRAHELAEQARAIGARYEPQEDSPAKLAAALKAWQQLERDREGGLDPATYQRRLAAWLMEQAESCYHWQDWDSAEQLAQAAGQLQVEYGPFDATPQNLLDRLTAARRRAGAARPGGDEASPATVALPGAPGAPAAPAVFEPAQDTSRNVPAQALGFPSEGDGPVMPAVAQSDEPTLAIPPAGESPFPADDGEPVPGEPGPLPESLPAVPTPAASAPPGSLLEGATAEQQVLARQMQAEIINRETAARENLDAQPQASLEAVQALRSEIEASALADATKSVMLRHVDRTLADFQRYLEENKARLELNAQNQQVLDDVERSRKLKIEVDDKLAKLVDEFNQLMDEQRWAEAELLAQRAEEMDPENPIVRQLKWQSRFVRRNQGALRLADEKERGVVDAFASVDESSRPFDDRKPLVFDAKRWEDLVKKRKGVQDGESPFRNEQEREIDQKLRTPVAVNFENRPLGEVLGQLAQLVDLNIWADPAGLAEEGVTTDQPVTINLPKEIQLRSALKLILEPLHLDYVIENEVLKITSAQLRSGNLVTQTYYVADLVTPIPNFVPNPGMGLEGAIRSGYSHTQGAMGGFGGQPPLAVLASRDGAPNSAVIDPNVLANVGAAGGLPGASAESAGPMGFGPGGLGAGAFADFDSLIQMITSTVAPPSWDEVGGAGTIQPWRNQFSLVVSQTQEVHEELVELLEQLRRLQDLQVTIEVRFITLNDNFFERIGVDFDFDINDDIDKPFQIFGRPTGQVVGNIPVRNVQDRDLSRDEGVTVGLQPSGLFTTDLDIPFRQGSFNLAVPQFGGFDPSAGVQMGFAILSDLEAFFLINAAQGDRRSNVLQAPKVTLFNGQQASVADVSQSPFVVSVIPVVGDFAAAQQPVIVVLNEGTFLTVQAVVSSDRRYVRLTVVPFFSTIGEVNTFTFAGRTTTTEETSSSGPEDDTDERAQNRTTTSEGTTVQLPTFSLVTVSTTVSVPDGGTVLLGGIKRLSEGRNEFGIPMLNKLPYINRLFKNVGIGRETQSLMMMVTPRIIIQEEEEEAILGTSIGP